MSEAAIHDHLAQVGGWQFEQGAIEKSFGFKNYHETIAFVNPLGWICDTENHLRGQGRCADRLCRMSVA